MSESAYRFSRRTAWDVSASNFSTTIAKARADGRELLDLTVSNPTQCGFSYDAEAILGPLYSEAHTAQALLYDPDPKGMRSAREAVTRYYSDHGAVVDADTVLLTTSTSEAYSFLFRLLCDAGDEVLVAQPSYPLFEFLADLDDILLKPYPLFYDFGWWIDFAELERRIGPRTRAILVVHPNNPTGHWMHSAEREKLEALCAARGLALIVDEVFLDYPLIDVANRDEGQPRSFSMGPHKALTFVLSGISKIAALPQMKVAWIAAFGPAQVVADALGRLEVIADTFLSVNSPAQLALPMWLADRGDLEDQIRKRTKENLQTLYRSGLDVLHVEAGWSAVLNLRGLPEDRAERPVETLLGRAGVIVHPGEFYSLPDPRMAVVSLLTPVEVFSKGIANVCLTIGQNKLLIYSQGEQSIQKIDSRTAPRSTHSP